MTDEERIGRMMSCAYNPPGGFLCQMGGYPPFDCGFCDEYASTENGGEEVGDDMSNCANVKIYIPANELWVFYTENKKRCEKEMILIAENTETEYAVYMTDDDGTLMFSVCKGDGEPEYEEYVMDDADCEQSAKKLFFRYLIPVTVIDGKAVLSGDQGNDELDGADVGLSRQEMEDEIYERDDALDFALRDFLAVVLEEPDGEKVADSYGQKFLNQVLHHFLEYLTNEHRIKIFRPMFFRDNESGCEIYSQYPYEEYTFSEDEELSKGDGVLPD